MTLDLSSKTKSALSYQNLSEQLSQQLIAYSPETIEEEAQLKTILKLVRSNQYVDITEQSLGAHHLTASAIITSRLGVCLHFHKRIHKWLQPGGHIDLGETPILAAQREVFEETGLLPSFDPEIFNIDIHDTGYGHTHYDIQFFGYCENIFINPPEDESQKVAWFELPTALNVVDSGIKRGLIKLQRK